jgi:FSR family fosmidomycin resistance protein-like MFS transporter
MRRIGALALVYGVMHGVVDLATVSATFRAARRLDSDLLGPFAIVVGYDLLAFALQTPLGLVTDRYRAARPALLVGLVLVLAAVATVPHSGVATMVLAGVGNALFHLAAGALVLSGSGGRAGPAGLFVAPGAFGLAMGLKLGRTGTGPLWPIGVAVALALVIAVLVRPERDADREPEPAEIRVPAWTAVVGLLLLSVLVRSYVGFGASYQAPKTALVLFGLPIAAVCGKALGGFVADRIGWLEASVGALLLSLPLIAFSHGSPPVVIAGVLLFQTTMPVTLTAVYRLMPTRPATAFGLPCLALVLGALPTFYPWGRRFYGTTTFIVAIAVSAAALYVALRAMGARATALRTAPG